jgi:hypothetical protein
VVGFVAAYWPSKWLLAHDFGAPALWLGNHEPGFGNFKQGRLLMQIVGF